MDIMEFKEKLFQVYHILDDLRIYYHTKANGV